MTLPHYHIGVADLSIPRDREAFLSLLDHYSRDPFGGSAPLDPAVIERLPNAWGNHAGAFSLIAWKETHAVGLVNCLTSFSTFLAAPRINIHDIVVHAEHRGAGLGRQLMDAVAAQARIRGACQITLEVRADNERARRFYESYGFHGLKSPVESDNYFFGVLKLT